ncbi:hypothetical protein SAMD00019534_041820 [Acytostelium subglobosum LB1]|uniref:hypothetical protein n=1 Tax=Acytostelium subglobosum LB1 TaxID=1410327 RepID=UPI000644F480|nr:hypothetical protein SAMD00019534_041820 [Acytostelium subglobosum LB1]GAM21007.1 hypothetical protein SAMD00019534_041820 [Acytostelium subglobosum LB1]|eukprot:XP_012756141.1 hypothetical protein SAMD00019534_041820 [Acytostelium subglobosum LB1]
MSSTTKSKGSEPLGTPSLWSPKSPQATTSPTSSKSKDNTSDDVLSPSSSTSTTTNTHKPYLESSANTPTSVLSSLQPQSHTLLPAFAQAAMVTTAPSSSNKRKRIFAREIKQMMYGFGDVREPLPDSVDLMEDIVTEYIQEMTSKAGQVSSRRGRFQTEDLVFLVRKDAKKYHRVIELLRMNEELKKAKRAFDDTQEPGEEEQ